MAAKSGPVVVPWQASQRLFNGERSASKAEDVGNAHAIVAPRQGKPSLSLAWQGADLPRVQPGNYRAVCIGWQGPEFVREFHRWSLRLEFSLLDDGTLVSAFFNFGNQSEPKMPKQRSRYYRAWSLANGEQPKKGQKLAFETFVDPELIYTVQVGDSATDGKGEAKPDALIYSRVTEILKVERGSLLSHQSVNHEPLKQKIEQSTNHPIKKASPSRESISPLPGERKRANSILKGRGFNSPPQASRESTSHQGANHENENYRSRQGHFEF